MNGNPFSAAVVRKTAFARALLRLATADNTDSITRAALCEGVVMHLHGGYLAFLREIGANYQLSDPSAIDTAVELREGLRTMGKTPTEATELCNLEQEADSWLGRLLAMYREVEGGCLRHPGSRLAEGLIKVKSVDAGAASIDPDNVQAVLAAFIELVDRHRETMIEC